METFTPDSSLVSEVRPSPNQGDRKDGAKPDMIVLHYTGMRNANAALDQLCSEKSEVSAHYLVFEDGRITQCVPEERRAWHAGESSWAGAKDVNSCSIGIEIANPGHAFDYPEFPRRQIAAVTALCRGIILRRGIRPERILGHSDVAPARKQDPGEKFPWQVLATAGVGIWVKPAPITKGPPLLVIGDRNERVTELQKQLAEFGYGLEITGHFDTATHDVVGAFQRHFRPEKVDGVYDTSTKETLGALIQQRRASAA